MMPACSGLALVAITMATISACGGGNGESNASESGSGLATVGVREIVVTRDDAALQAACRPYEVGTFLERFTLALRERHARVLRRTWGNGFRGMVLEDERTSRRLFIKSYRAGMRKLKRRRIDLRFDTVVVGAKGRDLLFVGKRFNREGASRGFFGKAGLRCTEPIGIRLMGVVTASRATIAAQEISCPPPKTPRRPRDTMVVCSRESDRR